MIIVLRKGATEEEIEHVVKKITDAGLAVHISRGKERTIIGAIGDEEKLAAVPLEALPGVEKAMPILKPYKLVSREFRAEDTVIDVDGLTVGKTDFVVMAGPCSVESREGLFEVAAEVKKAGARMLRGGAYKPRTSPYSFQGLGVEGLKILKEAKEATGLPVVSELMDPRDIEVVSEYVDVIQIGARNMQNFMLLKELGRVRKPILIKRGLAATIKELLMSAEYVASHGNSNIILCERGIRTFETATRNTLDISAVPVLKKETHLPVIVDPSHAVGRWEFVPPAALAALAVGADGLLVEVHQDPENAMSDGEQSLKPTKFSLLMEELKRMAPVVGRAV